MTQTESTAKRRLTRSAENLPTLPMNGAADPGAFATLHQINPLRLNWIERQTGRPPAIRINGQKV